jgi:hypothetical protein
MIVFGGIARNAAPHTLLLEEDTDTLLFRVGEGEDAAQRIMTAAEKAIWLSVSELREFTRSQRRWRGPERKTGRPLHRPSARLKVSKRSLDRARTRQGGVYRQGTKQRN